MRSQKGSFRHPCCDEYIRGIAVVKAFKQTVYSFRRLHDTIKEYTSIVIPYTLSWENSFSGFTTLINNLYLILLPVGILIGMNTKDYSAATASLDPESESFIQQAISTLIVNKTVIVIAHRLRTIVDADKIIVMNEGSVAEQGTHNELINKKGLCNKLYTIQQESLGWSI